METWIRRRRELPVSVTIGGREYMTIPEAAKIAGLAVDTMQARVTCRIVPSAKVGTRRFVAVEDARNTPPTRWQRNKTAAMSAR